MSARLLVRVGGLHTIDADLPSFRPTHLIGILDPTMPEPAAYRLRPPADDALVLRFRDTEVGVDNGPTSEHVETMLTFLDQRVFSAAAPGERLFIHCHAGASRSTATAYLALVRQHGVNEAEAAFVELLRITVKPWPNRRLVEFADTHLGARGRLLAPLDAYRAANPQRLRAYLRLHLRRAERDPTYGEKLGMHNWTVRPRA